MSSRRDVELLNMINSLANSGLDPSELFDLVECARGNHAVFEILQDWIEASDQANSLLYSAIEESKRPADLTFRVRL